MSNPDVYPDLFGDALSFSSQRMAQLASLVTAAATAGTRRKAQRDAATTVRSERALGELHDQERAAYQLARASWAPARDPRFMGQADLFQAVRTWSAAAAYADADAGAAEAARACEQRLRVLHPYAMAWYDRLRGDGAAPFDAMREALPLFARAPRARPGDPAAPRRELEASAAPLENGADGSLPSPGAGHGPAVAAGKRMAAGMAGGQAPGLPAAQLAAESFPCTAADAVRAAAQAPPSSARRIAVQQVRRPGRSA